VLQKKVKAVEPPAWHAGLVVGHRQFARVLDEFTTEMGDVIGPIDVAYETWGSLNATRSNDVLVLHAPVYFEFIAKTPTFRRIRNSCLVIY
jgi:homoserine O-acetyltransferase